MLEPLPAMFEYSLYDAGTFGLLLRRQMLSLLSYGTISVYCCTFFQERVSVGSSSCVSDEKLNVSETEALYGASSDIEGPSCFPDGPLSKNIFKPKNSDPKRTNRPKRVPYKPVDPKVTWQNWKLVFFLGQTAVLQYEYLCLFLLNMFCCFLFYTDCK